MAIVLSDNIQTNAPKSADSRYMNNLTPWADDTAAKAGIAAGVRYTGLTVNIGGVEYWWKDGIDDGDLVLKTTGGGSATSGQNVTKEITQASHGFAVKDFIGWSGGTYNKAIADGLYDGEFVGLVTASGSTDTFSVTQSGYITGLTGLVTDTTYFLSETTAGLLTDTAPTGDTQINKAVLIANSTTSGWILPYAGVVISSGNSGGGGDLNWEGTTANAVGTYVDEFTVCAQPTLTLNNSGQDFNLTKEIDDDMEFRVRNTDADGVSARGTVIAQVNSGADLGMFTYASGHTGSIWGESSSGTSLLWAGTTTEKLLIGTHKADSPVKFFAGDANNVLNVCSDAIEAFQHTQLCAGKQLELYPAANDDDRGDIVWYTSGGTETHRLWTDGDSTADKFYVRFSGDSLTTRCMVHTGNIADGSIPSISASTRLCAPAITLTTGAGSGCVLQSDGSGNATWETPSGGGGIAMSGSSANGITTYVNATTICSEPNMCFDGSLLALNATMNLTAAADETRYIQIGQGRTGSGYTYIDFIGDTTYTDYGLRVLRSNGGANTSSIICHRGTGQLLISTVDTAPIYLCTPNDGTYADCLVINDPSYASTAKLRVAASSTGGESAASFQGSDDDASGTSTAVNIGNAGTSGAQYYGIQVNVCSAVAGESGRAYGIRSVTGNRTTGYNFAVWGEVAGSNGGAALVGDDGSYTGTAHVAGTWAQINYGPTYMCGLVCSTTCVKTPTVCSAIIRGGASTVNICTTTTNVLAIRDSAGDEPYMSWHCNEGTRIGYIRACGASNIFAMCKDSGSSIRIGATAVCNLGIICGTGDIHLCSGAKVICVAARAPSGIGGNLRVYAGAACTTTSTSYVGGCLILCAGRGSNYGTAWDNGGTGGYTLICGGPGGDSDSDPGSTGGVLYLRGGCGATGKYSSYGKGGAVHICGGSAGTALCYGDIFMCGGDCFCLTTNATAQITTTSTSTSLLYNGALKLQTVTGGINVCGGCILMAGTYPLLINSNTQDKLICYTNRASGTNGGCLTISAQQGGSTSASFCGGAVRICGGVGGNSSVTGAAGGHVCLQGGCGGLGGTDGGNGGCIFIRGGTGCNSTTDGSGGHVYICAGSATSANAGCVVIYGGSSSSTDGMVCIYSYTTTTTQVPLTIRHGSTSTSTIRMIDFIRSSTNVGGIQTTNGTQSFRNTSDCRLKCCIANTTIDGLAVIDAIPVRGFNWCEDGTCTCIGYVAQEVEPIFNCAAKHWENDEWSVSPETLIPVLHKAIQQLSSKVETLEQEINILKNG